MRPWHGELSGFRGSTGQNRSDPAHPPDEECRGHEALTATLRLRSQTSVRVRQGAFREFQYPSPPLTVSLKRKREAVTKLSAQVVDQCGQPSPCSTTAYEMRSVAVPYGGCTEPSNVKAGGQACPIRFQCAGCGFYRPDPSYLPAIEQHINELRADRETVLAVGAAEFVTTALTAQISAYEQVVDRMRRRLRGLPEPERAQLEEASTVLRKARAGENHTLLPLTAVRKGEPR